MTPTSLNGLMSISANGVDVKGATGADLIFSDKYPFAKLDKTNNVSFQTINLLFNNEPPNPSGGGGDIGPKTTLVYQFPHGYNYVPSTWFLMQNPSQTGLGLQPLYQQEGGIILATNEGFFAAAIFRMQADNKNVYFYVDKYYDGSGGGASGPLPNIRGFSLVIRVYVFAGDLTGTPAGS